MFGSEARQHWLRRAEPAGVSASEMIHVNYAQYRLLILREALSPKGGSVFRVAQNRWRKEYRPVIVKNCKEILKTDDSCEELLYNHTERTVCGIGLYDAGFTTEERGVRASRSRNQGTMQRGRKTDL